MARLLNTTSFSVSSSWQSHLGRYLSKRFVIGAVVGEEEVNARSVNVRNRDDVGTKARTEIIGLEDVIAKFAALKAERRLENKI